MPNTWFTSDTHYHHTNICRGTSTWNGSSSQTRPFGTLEGMNETLVNNINALVMPDDVLYHLGDWSFGGQDKVGEFRQRLNVKTIHLILGNHDHHIADGKEAGWFTSVAPFREVKVDGHELVLFHYGMRVWNGSHRGAFHLYGHSHGSLPAFGRSMDVGVDTNRFSPYRYDEVRQLLAPKQAMVVDHHGTNAR